MKIAVLHCNGSVGSWRWVGSVFGSIKKYYPKTEIKVFYKSSGTLPRDTLARFSSMGLQLVDCEGLFKPKKKRILIVLCTGLEELMDILFLKN